MRNTIYMWIFSNSILRSSMKLGVVIAIFTSSVCSAWGQSDQSIETLQKNYEQSMQELRTHLKAAFRSETSFNHNDSVSAYDFRDQWEEAVENSKVAYAKMRTNAIALFNATDDPDKDLINLIQIINQKLIEHGQLTDCFEITKRLQQLRPDDESIALIRARIGLYCSDFAPAEALLRENPSAIKDLVWSEQALFSRLKLLTTKYATDAKIKTADDLPRVELETTKGKIVIELYEDQAPDTVANFIYLIESGFYNETIFHNVINNFSAQGGVLTFAGPKVTDYTINDESKRDNARGHFRGAVSLLGTADNRGSTQMIILRSPAPHLDNNHTVFGRVISDMRVVDNLVNTHTLGENGAETPIVPIVKPDSIVAAKVLRKRDHEYKFIPNRLPLKAPPEQP